MHIRKKTFVLIISYLAAAVLYMGVRCLARDLAGAGYRRTAEYGYSHAFSEVVGAVDRLDSALRRGSYASGSEMSAEICADIYGSCQAAGMTMAALPFSTQELEQTAAFLNIAGDYARYLLKTCGENGFGDTERENMEKLSDLSGGLSKSLRGLSDDLDSGKVLMDEPENVFADGGSYMSAAMLKYESELKELPELDYNGTYPKTGSKSVSNPVSEEKAKKAAEDFFGISVSDTLFTGENGAFCFDFDGGAVTVDAEGRVISMTSSRPVAGDTEDAFLMAAAESFLSGHGFENMRMTGSDRSGSVLTVSFACENDGILCENDCICVSVAADDGSIYAFDASDYYEHQGERQMGSPAVSEEEAREALPESLNVSGSRLVLCADNSLERLCYAFDCIDRRGEPVRICVDAGTGKQFKIEV